MGNIPLIILQ